MSAKAYIITPKTNLHVGSGKSNYGIIDLLVQRDHLTGLPHINASSLKGAFREYIEEGLVDKSKAETIFGAAPNNQNSPQRGTHHFLDGFLLSMPVRSSANTYYNATSPSRAKFLLDYADLLGLSINDKAILKNIADLKVTAGNPLAASAVILESYKTVASANLPNLAWLGERLAFFTDEDFEALCSDNSLPVIARNHLENGVSQNLWYEQVVPREARFITFIMEPNSDSAKFSDYFKEPQLIQIGGNATVGCGFCSVKLL